VAALVVALLGYSRWRKRIHKESQQTVSENAYAVAALAGGAQRLTHTAVVLLARKGVFVLGGDEGKDIVVAGPLPEDADEIESALYKEAVRTQPIRVLQLVQAGDGLRPVQDTVWALPAIPTGSRPSGWWLLPIDLTTLAIGLILFLNLTDSTGTNPPFIPILCGVSIAIVVILHILFRREGNPRKVVLSKIQERHPALRLIPGGLPHDLPPKDWAMAVALYGAPVLKGSMLDDYVALFGYVP
jgi:uncharacterized protein (TIGR04222 family)